MSAENRTERAHGDAANKSGTNPISRGPWARHCVAAPAEAGDLVKPDNPQSAGVVTRPSPFGVFSSLISRLTRFPVTFTSAYPKNQPSSYLFVIRKCPPA